MNKIKNFFQSEKFINKILPEIKRFSAVTLFTFIYGIGVVWFLEASAIPMYTGGMPGIGQVLRDLLDKMGVLTTGRQKEIFISAFIMLSNIPLLILGWFGVSKRFTLYSLVSVVIQSVVIGGVIPQINSGLQGESHALAAAVLGGILVGIGTGGALKYGTSTGGLDIIAQYLSFKNGKSVGFLSMVMNVLIALAGGLIAGGELAGLVITYTIIRIIMTTVVTDRIHTSYEHISVEIITEHPQELVDEILHKIARGVTLIKVEGAYSHHEKTMVVVVISSYELDTLVKMIKNIDEKAFVVAKPVKGIVGNFKRKRIA